MMRTDEKIAILEKQKRLEQKEKEKEEKRQELTFSYTVEELKEKIPSKKLMLGFLKIVLEMKTVTEGNLKIPFIIDFFDVIEEKEQSVWYASNQYNVTFVLVFLKEKKKRMPISEWKKFLVKEMRGNQIFMDVKKTKEMEKLDYICYETPSGKGTFYNITFQLNEEKGYFVGTFGCDQKQKETMGVLLEAMVQQINDDRKEEGGNHSGSDYL